MIINEDTAAAYAMGLAKCLGTDLKQDTKEYKAMGANFNRKRIPLDNIFNYTNANVFANDVLNIFNQRYPALFRKYNGIIRDLASNYAEEKMKVSRVANASVETNFKYFNY